MGECPLCVRPVISELGIVGEDVRLLNLEIV